MEDEGEDVMTSKENPLSEPLIPYPSEGICLTISQVSERLNCQANMYHILATPEPIQYVRVARAQECLCLYRCFSNYRMSLP